MEKYYCNMCGNEAPTHVKVILRPSWTYSSDRKYIVCEPGCRTKLDALFDLLFDLDREEVKK